MKPSKKQNSSKSTKEAKEKNSSSGIKTFFKTAPKSFVVDENVAEPAPSSSKDVNKTFYVEILKEKLSRIHGERENISADITQADAIVQDTGPMINAGPMLEKANSGTGNVDATSQCIACAEKSNEIGEWMQKYQLEVEERKHWKKLYFNLTHNFSELHSKHKDLLKVATKSSVDASLDNEASGTSKDDIFTAAEEKFLRCMDLGKKTDCTFVLHCLKYAYKGNRPVLAERTLFGTLECTKISDVGVNVFHPAKDPLTPRKVERIKNLFIERISNCKLDSVEYAERVKDPYVNKLIAAGIKNLSNTTGVKTSTKK